MSASYVAPVFEDYDPPTDLVTEDASDTLLIYLPGFKKEQLKVQLTVSKMLKISGQRPLGGNKYRRFQKEFRVPPNCDTKEISAKFEGGILYIRQPKLIIPAAPPLAEPPRKTPAETPRPQQQPPPQPQVSVPPPLQLPQPQSQQHAPPPPPPSPPQLQSQKHAPPTPPLPPPPSPQSQPQQEAVAKGKEEETRARGNFKEEMGSKDEASRDESDVIQQRRQVVTSGLFRELRKPDNMKRFGVSVLLVLIIAFYISYMFKSLLGNGHEIMSEYDREL
ncbi:hypothetical protein RND81_05G257900 [Saponaria officinalis]|uniref:SHSP domain-containing protein n=1 Tax=Saponaria officinalis TaxID=3572 RepID=A0AAW1KZY6_SAPOF